ncbi:MAG: RluA family pseudouridine synthase [Prevotella sp.]|nr:RluA family pseudouridine synthase [Prevotella sp.]
MFGVLVVQAPHHSPTSSDSQSVSSNSQPVSSNSRPISANTHFPSPISPQSPFPTVVSTPLPLGEGSGERLEEQEGRLAGSERPSFLFLSAYSGQICGRSDWPEFVPAVFDYLQEDGYFKREEAEIVKINEEIGNIPRPLRWEGSADAAGRPQMEKGRKDGESEDDYVRRRQFENAELHRWKVAERSRKATFEDEQRQKAEKIQSLKTLRRQKSDSLQRWLFRRFVMRNALGETRNLLDIWGGEAVPPAGSGECCEPKLLQYAFDHGLKPVSMAMFWWGESPREEVRHHLQCYPACNGKCKPILRWMLRGMDVEPNPLEAESRHALPILFEDNDICVVNKPAGMLSVQGKSRRESVQSVMRKRYPDANSPLIVHRLDMATSGLMVIAKTMDAYRGLQRQFLRHEVRKRYVAELTHDLPQREGDITLPLRPDLDDRPRQMVDAVYGKPAETHFERVGDRRVALYPHTGRTHQLRVHCAHRLGLNNPIRGDELYGQRADRLYLHAESLTFTHPRTGESLTFTAPAPF